jgi:hypothetical protein
MLGLDPVRTGFLYFRVSNEKQEIEKVSLKQDLSPIMIGTICKSGALLIFLDS